MQITMTKFDAMTDEKAAYVEEQANKLFQFVMESRQQLTAEAHTTLNWLFLVMIGSCGYIPSLLDMTSDIRWWLIVPLAAGACFSGYVAARLFYHGMRLPEVIPAGNDPKNLLTDEAMAYDMAWIRVAETTQLQERVDGARDNNVRVANAVNEARWCLVALPAIELALGTITRLFVGA